VRDKVIFGLVLSVTIFAATFYAVLTVAPLFDGTCPTATPLLIHGRLFCRAVLRTLRRSVGRTDLDSEAGHRLPDGEKPPWDPDVVLSDVEGVDSASRDIEVLTLMINDMPAGHDMDTALDAVGGLDPECHRLRTEDLNLVRSPARLRLKQLGAAVGTPAADATAIARALRSSIFIESALDPQPWSEFESIGIGLGSIRTHGVFQLSAVLRLKLQIREIQEWEGQPSPPPSQEWVKGREIEEQDRWQLQRELRELREQQKQQPLSPQQVERLQTLQRQQGQQGERRERQQWQPQKQKHESPQPEEFQIQLTRQRKVWQLALDLAEPIARWTLRADPTSLHPISLSMRLQIFDGIIRVIATQPASLNLCAALVLGFGCDPGLRQRCNEIVTPLAIATLEQDIFFAQAVTRGGPVWHAPSDSTDWRLRTISFWAHVTSSLFFMKAHIPMVGEAYAELLAHWRDEKQWPRLLAMDDLRRIVLPARQPSLPPRARATLWNIVSSASASTESWEVQTEVVRDVLQGMSLNEMVAANPTIVSSVIRLVRPWFCDRQKRDHGREWNYQRFSKAHRRLLSILGYSSIFTARSGQAAMNSTWEVIRPYLIASSDDASIARLTTQATAVLSTHAAMSGDVADLLEHLLGGGIGRRIILSHAQRDDAFFVATHARHFAIKWWEELRGELQKAACKWEPTEGFESATIFVNKVEQEGVCVDCIQLGCAWEWQQEKQPYRDAWIEHTQPGWAAVAGSTMLHDLDVEF